MESKYKIRLPYRNMVCAASIYIMKLGTHMVAGRMRGYYKRAIMSARIEGDHRLMALVGFQARTAKSLGCTSPRRR